MPDFYAHYRQGQQVFALLPENIRTLISNKHLYDIGLQGPDFLYYHKPLQKNDNPILQLATDIHIESGTAFLTAVQKNIAIAPATDEFSYLMGCIGHFGLDSCSHPYVNRMVTELNFDHAEMEIEFDKFLLSKDGVSPFSYKAYRFITLSDCEVDAVARVYHAVFSIIAPADIRRAFNTFKYGKHIFYMLARRPQCIGSFILRCSGLYESLQGHIMKTALNPKTDVTNSGLLKCYDGSIKITVDLMQNFYENLVYGTPLSQRFDHRFA